MHALPSRPELAGERDRRGARGVLVALEQRRALDALEDEARRRRAGGRRRGSRSARRASPRSRRPTAAPARPRARACRASPARPAARGGSARTPNGTTASRSSASGSSASRPASTPSQRSRWRSLAQSAKSAAARCAAAARATIRFSRAREAAGLRARRLDRLDDGRVVEVDDEPRRLAPDPAEQPRREQLGDDDVVLAHRGDQRVVVGEAGLEQLERARRRSSLGAGAASVTSGVGGRARGRARRRGSPARPCGRRPARRRRRGRAESASRGVWRPRPSTTRVRPRRGDCSRPLARRRAACSCWRGCSATRRAPRRTSARTTCGRSGPASLRARGRDRSSRPRSRRRRSSSRRDEREPLPGAGVATVLWAAKQTRTFDVPPALSVFAFGCNDRSRRSRRRASSAARPSRGRARVPTYTGTYPPFVLHRPGRGDAARGLARAALRAGRLT